jgi:hypothetical protein
VVEAVIDLPGDDRNLTLAVEHWKSGTGNDDEFRRAVESNRIAQVLDDQNTWTDLFVIVGDLNEEADSVPNNPDPFTKLPSGLPSSWALGSDLMAELNGPGIRNDPFLYLTRLEGPHVTVLDAWQLDGSDGTRPASGRRLDYIMASKALTDMNPATEVYDSADEGLPGGLPKFGSPLPASASQDASDHFLVFTDIVIQSTSCSSDAECDDLLFCNGLETCDTQLGCQPGTPVDCDNGVFCDGTEVCDNALGCQAGTPPDCSALSDSCNDATCDAASDACVQLPLPDGTTCDNGDACQGDVCQSGSCMTAPCGPAAPEGLSGEFGRNVSLSWSANSEPNLAGYRVYRSTTSGGPYSFLAKRKTRHTSYTDRRPGKQFFCYVVTAYDKSGGESDYSNEVCGQAGR